MSSTYKLNRSKSTIIFHTLISLKKQEITKNIKNNFYSKEKKKYKNFLDIYLKQKIKNSNQKKQEIKLKRKYKKDSDDYRMDNGNCSSSTKDSSYCSIINNNKNNLKTLINKKIIDFEYSKNYYCNYIPNKIEMREMADKKPCHLPIECFHGENITHNEIGDKEFLDLKEENIFNSNNDSYKIIEKKDHILLNHLCIKNLNKKFINSFTIKYRHKNTTFLYYK